MSIPIHTVFLPLSLMLTACPPATDPTQQRPPPVGQDAAVLPDGATATPCEASCYAYRTLGCPEGADTKKGHKCEEVCQNAAANGIDLSGQTSCIVESATCQEVRACSK